MIQSKSIFTLALSFNLLLSPLLQAQQTAGNRIIQNLLQDQPVIGTFTRSPAGDLDFAIIDEQYGEFDIEAVGDALAGMQVDNRPPLVAPIVRIPLAARERPQTVVQQLLDAGVFGLMFPDIETKQQAMAAISSMRFGPEENPNNPEPAGLRGSNSGSAADYWGLSESDYQTQADVWPLNPAGKLVAMIQIESPLGIDNLDEILQVPGIGVIFLGPTDIATAIGAQGPDSPQVELLVQQVLRVCLARNIPCGYPIVATSPEQAELATARRLGEGFKVLAVMTRPE